MISSSVGASPVKQSRLSAVPPPSSGPIRRLVATHIVAENFKSYHGRHTIGPFHKSFTSIVGPNGSGKSNVIDAFMFVLGYRAKRLRQAKLGDLIHESAGVDPSSIDSCTVEVHFEVILDSGSEEAAAVPDSQFAVSRQAFRNGRNAYRINGQACAFDEVAALMKSHGVDLDQKRFLILQGEVESIALMKPRGATEHEEGLLEYLEDIIGSNRLIRPIEEAAKGLLETTERCNERLLRCRLAQRECDELAEDKESAVKYVQLENEIVMRKGDLYQATAYRAKQQAAKTRVDLEASRAKLAELQSQHGADGDALAALEAQHKEQASVLKKADDEAAKVASKSEELERKDIQLKTRRDELKKKLAGLQRSTKDEQKAKADVERDLASIDVELAALAQQSLDLAKSMEAAEAELDAVCHELKSVTGTIQAQLEAKQAELEPWHAKIRAQQEVVNVAQAAMQMAEAKANAGAIELAAVTAELHAAEQEHQRLAAQKSEFEQSGRQLHAKAASIEAEHGAADAKCRTVRSEVSVLQSTIAEAEESIQAGFGGQLVGALMREAAKSSIRGIYGRLGSLGTIDDRFDVAVSTACAQLDFIVVDTTETGQRCIDVLRRDNLGRASFIILDKLRPVPSGGQLPQGALRLFDLVRPSKAIFAPAFYHALQDTLVAESMHEATRLAYQQSKRYRVVTLDGKIIDTSGTISGGGTRVASGGMRASQQGDVTPEQLQSLKAALDGRQQELRQLSTHMDAMAKALRELRSQMVDAEREATKLDVGLRAMPDHIRSLQARGVALRASSDGNREDIDRFERLQREFNAQVAALGSIHASCAPAKAAVAALQAQIMEAGGVKYRMQKHRVDALRDQAQLARDRQCKLEAQRQALSKPHGSLRAERNEAEVCAIAEQLKALEAEMQSITEAAVACATQQQSIQKSVEQHRLATETLQGAIRDKQRHLQRFMAREYELKASIEGSEESLAASEALLQQCSASFQTLRLNPILWQTMSGKADVIAVYEDEQDLAEIDVSALQHSVAQMESRLASMRANLKSIGAWQAKNAVLQAATAEHAELERERGAARAAFESLSRQRHEEFMAGLRSIGHHLRQMYALITMGGTAELELVDSLDPFAEGINFSVMPPRKAWKTIANLSGGEKTLASLSLVFALHCYRPTPIYVMDEIDAALDFRNVSIVASYIRHRTVQSAQFLVISLRSDMFEQADRLVGVYKVRNQTRAVAVDPARFAPLLQQ